MMSRCLNPVTLALAPVIEAFLASIISNKIPEYFLLLANHTSNNIGILEY